MPKRDASPRRSSTSKKQKTVNRRLINYQKSAKTRKGYQSVARPRGAAVVGEMKYFDAVSEVAIVATTTTWPAGTMSDPTTTINLGSAAVANPLCLMAPTVGSGLNQRVGREVKVMKIKIHGQINIPAQSFQSGGDTSAVIRLLLVQDTQTNSAQMTGAQLFNDASSALTTLQSFQNPNNFGRFKVLRDKMMTFSNINVAGSPTTGDLVQSGMAQKFKLNYVFPGGVSVRFNNTNGGTVADIIDNSFHIVCAAQNITMNPQLYYYSRVCYKE